MLSAEAGERLTYLTGTQNGTKEKSGTATSKSQTEIVMDVEKESRYTLDLDIRYGICYNQLQCRFLSRVDSLFKIIEVLLGSTAFISFFNDRPAFAGIAGLALAGVNAMKVAIDFGDMASKAETQCRRFSDLLLVADDLDLNVLRRQLKLIQSGDAPAIETLRLPAYSRNLIEQGRDECVVGLSWRERIMVALA